MVFFGLITYLILLPVFFRPLSTIIHELGHGITTLLLTKQNVAIYLGSYGNSAESLNYRLGRINFFIKKNLLKWNGGLCLYYKHIPSLKKQITINLMGPLMTLLLALIVSLIVFYSSLSNFPKAVLFFYAVHVWIEFFTNIIPSKKQIHLTDGTSTFNDGKNIMNNIIFIRIRSEYEDALEKINNNEFSQAAEILRSVIRKGYRNDHIYRLLISSYLTIYDYKSAEQINEQFELENDKNDFDSDDYNRSGLIKSYFKKFPSAIEAYNKALALNSNNCFALNNRAYTYLIMAEYNNALVDFNRAIELEPDSSYAYSNRGLSKILLGITEEGLADLNKSLELDQNNSYAHMNLGINHFNSANYTKALEKFEQAFNLNPNTYDINIRIEETKAKLKMI